MTAGWDYYIGIDLGCSALSKSASSAVAIMDADGKLIEKPKHFRRAAELVEILRPLPRDRMIIAVDAPRSVPDHTNENYARRSCEYQAQAKLKEHAGSFSGVAALFVRWFEIETAYFADVKVIETYPRLIWRVLDLPGKAADFNSNRSEVWSAVTKATGCTCDNRSHHALDSVLCAFTAYSYAKKQVRWFGAAGEGVIVVPDVKATESCPSAEAELIQPRFRNFKCMAVS